MLNLRLRLLLILIISNLTLLGVAVEKNELVYKKDNLTIHVVNKSILNLDVDAIVNPANESLRHLGGLCGIIHNAAGPKLEEECLKLPVFKYSGDPKTPQSISEIRCLPGQAKITKGYNLKAKNVIHAVGPDCRKEDQNKSRKKLLSDVYKNSIKCSEENKLKSVAFPAISCGIFEYPIQEATEVAVHSCLNNIESSSTIKDIYFVVISKEHFDIYKTILEAVLKIKN